MPRWLQQLIFAALIALALGVAVEAELQEARIYDQTQTSKAAQQSSQSSNPATASSSPKQREKRAQESNWYGTFLNHPTDWLLVLFNGILAAFTIRLFYATSGLAAETAGLRSAADKQSADMQASIKASVDSAKAAIASNQIAIYTTEQQLRAYVTASGVNMETHRVPGTMSGYGAEIPGRIHTYEFAVVLKNGGQTPAINVRTNLNVRIFQTGIPNDFDFSSSDRFGHGLIGPQIEWQTPWQQMSSSLIDDISTTIGLWGWVEYDDIFTASGSTSRHRTEFCYRIDRRHLPITRELFIGFIPHYRFNAADGDCLRPIDPATGHGGG